MAIHSLPILSPEVYCEPMLIPSTEMLLPVYIELSYIYWPRTAEVVQQLGYRLDNQGTGVDFWLGQGIFLFVTTTILALRLIQLPNHWMPGLFPWRCWIKNGENIYLHVWHVLRQCSCLKMELPSLQQDLMWLQYALHSSSGSSAQQCETGLPPQKHWDQTSLYRHQVQCLPTLHAVIDLHCLLGCPAEIFEMPTLTQKLMAQQLKQLDKFIYLRSEINSEGKGDNRYV